MSNPLVSSQFVRLLDKRLREVAEEKYADLPTMVPTIFNVLSSESAWEEFYEVGATPDIPEFNGKISYLAIDPGFHKKIEHKEYAAGKMWQRKLIDDKKYNVLENDAKGLMAAAHRTREKQGVRAFAYAESATFDYMTSEEGVGLCSSSHTTKSSVSTTTGFDNSGTTAMSKTAIAATRLLMRGFKNNIGERIEVGDDLALVVPDALADTAAEIVGSAKDPESANNTINPQYQRYEVIPWLRLDDYDSNDWYMVWKSQMKEDLVWFDRILPETESTVDFETKMYKFSVYFRNSYGWKDWRWIYKQIVS
jgi:hypothetical protein